MRQRLEVFIFLGISVISGLNGDSECKPGYTCLPRGICDSFQSERRDLRKLGKEKGTTSSEYKALLERLKSLICNQAEGKICCDKAQQPTTTSTTTTTTTAPTDQQSFPNFIPSIDRGECGVTGDAAFIYGERKLQSFFLLLYVDFYFQVVKTPSLVNFPGWLCWGQRGQTGTSSGIVEEHSLTNGEDIEHWAGVKIDSGSFDFEDQWFRFVLTAAHCGPTVDFVRLGEWKVVDTSKFAPTDGKFEADTK